MTKLPFFKALQNKANTIAALHFRTKYGKAIVSNIVFLESLLEEIAEPNFEITRDNIVSTKVRDFLGYKSPLDIPEPVRDTSAKSKWQEILNGAEKLNKDKDFRNEHTRRTLNRVIDEIIQPSPFTASEFVNEEPVGVTPTSPSTTKGNVFYTEAKAFSEEIDGMFGK